jgi:hypothetical protein
MPRAPSGMIFAPFARSMFPIDSSKGPKDFAALIAHGIFSSMPVLEVTSPGIPRSRRQWAGL